MNEWKLIETSPIETAVLVYEDGVICVSKKEIWWKDHDGSWETVGASGYEWESDVKNPTHWMPLPEPPKC